VTTTFRSMGCEVVVGGAGEDELRAIARLFDERDRLFSRFRADSELCCVNRARGEAVPVSREFSRAARAALAAARKTGGLVDPTVGAAIEALGYTRDFDELEPDPEPVRPVPAGRWRSVTATPLLLWRPPDLLLDLNCVVKSLAVDDALSLLPEPGFVSAGGDLAARGGVVVGLPGSGTLELREGGLATSGTRRRWLKGGEEQHHLIDPGTGRASASPWFEVTVAASSCLAADVAAKAAFLLGEDGPDWLDARGLPGRFLAGDEIVENLSWHRAVSAETGRPRPSRALPSRRDRRLRRRRDKPACT
jgi:FAD:protein FMN transferase